jgi:glucose-6-phosphate 1-epimerase
MKINSAAGPNALPSSVRVAFAKGQGGLPKIQVQTKWSHAEIYLHGAHVTHFQKQNEPPILWLSEKSRFDENVAIRGGIPVIFPWFGGREGKPAHGFARVKAWSVEEITLAENGGIRISLRLPDCAEAAEFPAFTLDYHITVADTLELELTVTNTSQEFLNFEECLHTYFTVGDIAKVSVTGLKGVAYLDKVGGSVEKTETGNAIIVASEVDRVYQDTAAAVEIRDEQLRRKIIVAKENSNSTVVWNPWIAKSKAMADFGDEEYHSMICVESGNVGKNKVMLEPGRKKSLRVKLSSVTL